MIQHTPSHIFSSEEIGGNSEELNLEREAQFLHEDPNTWMTVLID
jgi:hypothetical protein